MNLLSVVIQSLEAAGYETRSTDYGAVRFEFEDAVIFGFVAVYDSSFELLKSWKADHDRYVVNRASQIRSAAEKRANLYAVFLTADTANREQARSIGEIEENFVASRKVIGVGLDSREQVTEALLPLLPIQSSVRLEQADFEERVRSRLAINQGLYEKLFKAKDPDELVQEVLGE